MSIRLDTEVFCIYLTKLKYINRYWEVRGEEGEVLE